MATARNELLEKLGTRVRARRSALRLTASAVAERSGLSLRFLSDVEGGRANISVVNLQSLAQALGLSAAGLLAEDSADRRGVLALIGLRGAGKSSIGAKLANRLALPFYELDRLIEA